MTREQWQPMKIVDGKIKYSTHGIKIPSLAVAMTLTNINGIKCETFKCLKTPAIAVKATPLTNVLHNGISIFRARNFYLGTINMNVTISSVHVASRYTNLCVLNTYSWSIIMAGLLSNLDTHF